MSFSSSLTVL